MQCQPTKQLNPKWSLNVTTMRTNSWQQTTKSTIPSIFEFKQSPIEIPTEKELFCYWKHIKTFEGQLKKVGGTSHTSGNELAKMERGKLAMGWNLQIHCYIWYICNKARLRSFNPLHHNISMHILHTVHHTFLKVLTRRIWLSIKSFFSWWSFPSLLRPSCMIQKRYCKEKLDFIHIKGLNTNRLLFEPKLNRMKITSNDYIHFCACLFKTCLPYLGKKCMNNFILTCFLSC